MMRRWVLSGVLAGGFLLSGLVFSPVSFAAEADKKNVDTYRLLNLFGDVFERVRSDYVDKPTDKELVESAITGMLTALDPHSSYLNAERFREMQVETKGQFGGLGIQITMENGLVKIISPIDDTPAARAGLEPNDFITHLDDQPVRGMTLAESVEKMRGPVGTDIRVKILREGSKPFEVTLTRAIVKVSSVRSRVEGKAGYVRITSFNEQTDIGLKKAMAKIQKELGDDLQGIVLDLRNNPGGLLNQAIAVSDAFMDKGEIVSTRSRRAEDTQRFNARPGDLANGKPVIVLINGGSASASEIVAGALQDHGRGLVLGTKSFGKGSVQTIIPLSGHGAMRLTTARYYTPSGRSIQAVGIVPDIVVSRAKVEEVAEARRTRESDLRGALDNGNGKKDAEPADAKSDAKVDPKADPKAEAAAKAKAAIAADYQLVRALDLLRGVSLFQKAK